MELSVHMLVSQQTNNLRHFPAFNLFCATQASDKKRSPLKDERLNLSFIMSGTRVIDTFKVLALTLILLSNFLEFSTT